MNVSPAIWSDRPASLLAFELADGDVEPPGTMEVVAAAAMELLLVAVGTVLAIKVPQVLHAWLPGFAWRHCAKVA